MSVDIGSIFKSVTDFVKPVTDFAGSKSGRSLLDIGKFGFDIYNANKTNDLLDKQNDLTLANYKYNQSINDREIAKENLSNQNNTDAFNSVFGTTNKKKKLTDYYGTTNFEG